MALFKRKVNTVEVEDVTKEVEEIVEPMPIQEEEIWVWAEGIKGTRADGTPRFGTEIGEYKVGEVYKIEGDLEECENGLHFSATLEEAMKYYPVTRGNRYFKVRGLVKEKNAQKYGTIIMRKRYNPYSDVDIMEPYTIDKYVAKELEILEEVPFAAYSEHIKTMYVVDEATYRLSADKERFMKYVRDLYRVRLLNCKLNDLFIELLLNKLMVETQHEPPTYSRMKPVYFYDYKVMENTIKAIEAVASNNVSMDMLVYTILNNICSIELG